MTKYRSQQGQTLVEVLVTILFMAIGVIALIRFQNYLSYDNSVTQQKGTATILAMQEIETLRDYHVLTTTSGYTAYSSIASGSSTYNGTTATYTITWTVTANTNPTYKNINVTVSWSDRIGNSQSIQLSTDVASLDPANSAAVM